MKNEVHYNEYAMACQAIEEIKAHVAVLRSEGEMAATHTRNETIGTTKEKTAAIRQVWAQYNSKIAQVETDIAIYRQNAEAAWDAYEHSRGCN